MAHLAVPGTASDTREYRTASVSSVGSDVGVEDLHNLAERMRRELYIKERFVGTTLHKGTFKGQQAIAWLMAVGAASGTEDAAEVLHRLTRAGYIKQLNGQVQPAAGVSELYRFVLAGLDHGSGDGGHGHGDSHHHKSSKLIKLSSGTLGAGIYKELAKFGKAAGHTFKNVGLDITGSHHKSSSGHKSDSETSRRSNGRHGMHLHQGLRSSQQQQQGVDHAAAAAALMGHLNETQSHVRENLALMRLDLQQHTALQEHMIRNLEHIVQHSMRLQLLIGLQCALLALLVLSTGRASALLLGTLAAATAGAAWVLKYGAHGTLQHMLQQVGLMRRQPSVSVARNFARTESTSGTPQGLPRRPSTFGSALGQSQPATEGAGLSTGAGEPDDDQGDDVADDDDAVPCLSDYDDWPDSPLLMRPNAAAPEQTFNGTSGPCQSLRLNSAEIPFESDVFKGALLVYIRGLPSTPPQLFKGKKRVSWIVLQGMFKKPLSLDSVVFGQEFRRAFKNLPAPWFIDNMLIPLARKISPSLRFGTMDAPYMMTPLITSSQIVHVAAPGSAPGMMEAEEDMRLFNPILEKAGGPCSTSQRRKFFQNSSNRVKATYTTNHVWTFHLWQEFLDFGANQLNLSYQTYDLNQHLDGEPLQVMVKDCASGAYLINCQLWHRSMVATLPCAHRPPERQRRRQSIEEAGPSRQGSPTNRAPTSTTSAPASTAGTPAAMAAATASPESSGSFAFAPSTAKPQQQQQAQAQAQATPSSRPGSPVPGMPPPYPTATDGAKPLQGQQLLPAGDKSRVLAKPHSFAGRPSTVSRASL